VPSSGTLRWQTYITTQETGTTAYDTLVVKLGSTTVQTLSNTSTSGAWFSTSVPLAPYAGQTLPLSFTATNGTKLLTTFWVDDVTTG
jgi:NADH dehydrogenase FAD-containing subunit